MRSRCGPTPFPPPCCAGRRSGATRSWARAAGLGPVPPDDAGLAHLTGWVGRFLTLHEAWAPVFASFLAASRDHRPEAQPAGVIADRTAVALLEAFGVEAGPRSAALAS